MLYHFSEHTCPISRGLPALSSLAGVFVTGPPRTVDFLFDRSILGNNMLHVCHPRHCEVLEGGGDMSVSFTALSAEPKTGLEHRLSKIFME